MLKVEGKQTSQEILQAACMRNAAQKQLHCFQTWTEDLHNFFQARPVNDSNTIIRCLQALMREDPTVKFVEQLLSTLTQVDLASPMVQFTRTVLMDAFMREHERLNTELVHRDAALSAKERKLQQVEHDLHVRWQQIQAFQPRAGTRLDAIATPLRNDKVFRRSGMAAVGALASEAEDGLCCKIPRPSQGGAYTRQ